MSPNAYELLALCMRYVFALIMVLIVFRAWRVTLVDGRRSFKLRRLSPETGIVGEFLVVDGHDRAKYGMHYPLTLEGTIGSARENDIRLRSASVRRRHAIFQMTETGLYIRSHSRGKMYDSVGRPLKEVILNDGDFISIGAVRLMLILSDGIVPPGNVRIPRRYNAETAQVSPGISRDGEDLFEVASAGRNGRSEFRRAEHMRRRNEPRPKDDPDDVFFDYDEFDDC